MCLSKIFVFIFRTSNQIIILYVFPTVHAPRMVFGNGHTVICNKRYNTNVGSQVSFRILGAERNCDLTHTTKTYRNIPVQKICVRTHFDLKCFENK